MNSNKKGQLQICRKCNISLFPTELFDDSWAICPLCSRSSETLGIDKLNNNLFYCNDCNIIFKLGCYHYYNENEQIYNTALMESFKKDNKLFQGMLVFDSKDMAELFIKDMNNKLINVIFKCTCNGSTPNCEVFEGLKSKCKIIY